MPLGDLGVDVNVPVSISRRDKDGSKDYARVVKKLKVGQKDQKNDIVRQDLHEEGPLSVSSFVETRVEDDQIHGSPRKKLGHWHNASEDVLDAPPDMQIIHEIEDEDATEDEENDVADRQELPTPSYADTDILQRETESVVEGLDNCTGNLPISVVQGEHDYTTSHISLAFVSEGQRPSTTLDTENELAVVPEIEDASNLSDPESAIFENDLTEMAATQKDSPTVESAEADETLFLQNFVQKSKAEKEARETELSNDASADTLVIAPSLGKTPEDAEVQTSPLRRSKRAAVTGSTAPRFAGLVSTIQLKRASGNEFIFRAGKSGANGSSTSSNLMNDAAHIGVVTRANTRRNKGTALNVKYRLEQLQDGSGGAEQQEAVRLVVDGQPATVFSQNSGRHDTAGDRRKKRAGDSMDEEPRVAKKVLRWNDAELVQYSEVPAREIPSSDAEADGKEGITPADSNRSVTKIQLKLRTATNSVVSAADEEATKIEGSATEAQKDQLDGSAASQTKVKRTRARPGTPVSNRNTTRIDNFAATGDGTCVTNTTSATVPDGLQPCIPDSVAVKHEHEPEFVAMTTKPAKPARKSRMPVPTNRATPIGKSAAISARGSASTASKVSQSSQSGGKTDLLGPRRLRVRS